MVQRIAGPWFSWKNTFQLPSSSLMSSRMCKLQRSPSERHVNAAEAAGSSEVSDKGKELKWLLLPTSHTAAFPEGGRPQQKKLNWWGSCFWMAAIYCVICKNEDQRVYVKMLSCKWRQSGKRCDLFISPCCWGVWEEWSLGLLQLSLLQSTTAGGLAPSVVIFQRLWMVCGKLPIPQEIPYERDLVVSLSPCPSCPSSKLLLAHSSSLKETEKPKPNTLFSRQLSLH